MCTCLSSVGQAFTFQSSAGGNNLICNIIPQFKVLLSANTFNLPLTLITINKEINTSLISTINNANMGLIIIKLLYVKMVQCSGVPDRSDWEAANSSWETEGELKKWNRYLQLCFQLNLDFSGFRGFNDMHIISMFPSLCPLQITLTESQKVNSSWEIQGVRSKSEFWLQYWLQGLAKGGMEKVELRERYKAIPSWEI